MQQQLLEHFVQTFGAPAELLVISPGRVNLIGEHTDYNEGWVFPAALDMGTFVAARRRDDALLRTVAVRMGAEDAVPVADPHPLEVTGWTRYVRGVAALLLQDGYQLPGADLMIDGNLPLGSGLSSSASLELGIAVALLELAGASISRTDLARLGQRTENQIVGVQSGIMDQLAVACGVDGHALLIDCRSYQVEPVPIPSAVRILILDSAVPRTLAGSAYNQRRSECESALQNLQQVEPGLRALRDVTPELLAAQSWRLNPVELRRARHVVSENQRVLQGVEALRNGDAEALGRLMVDSHTSLRDDYEVSGPELDMLVTIALQTPGVLGARLTGAGFGGCAVALVQAEHAESAASTISARYQRETGKQGLAFVSAPADGAHARWLPQAGEGSR